MKELIERFEGLELIEGINDPYILKAIFTAGGPGSGKTFVSAHAVKGLGVKFVNSDEIFEKYLDRAGLTKKIGKPDTELYGKQMVVRKHAKEKTKSRMDMWIDGMLGLVIDGTGRNYGKISRLQKLLKANGYDVGMIFVNTSLETSLKRNRMRTRSVDEGSVKKMWSNVQSNIGKFQSLFGNENFFIIDSNKHYKGADLDAFTVGLRRVGMKWLSKPVKNPIGKNIIKRLKDTGGKTLSDLRNAKELAADIYVDFIDSCFMVE